MREVNKPPGGLIDNLRYGDFPTEVGDAPKPHFRSGQAHETESECKVLKAQSQDILVAKKSIKLEIFGIIDTHFFIRVTNFSLSFNVLDLFSVLSHKLFLNYS